MKQISKFESDWSFKLEWKAQFNLKEINTSGETGEYTQHHVQFQ